MTLILFLMFIWNISNTVLIIVLFKMFQNKQDKPMIFKR